MFGINSRKNDKPEQGSVGKRLKNGFNNTMENALTLSSAQARVKKLPRWRELSGVDNDADIDYDDPIISTEFLLCDQNIQTLLVLGKRDKVLAQMNDHQR